MQIASYDRDLSYDDKRIKTQVMLESSFSKEIRILLKRGQIMQEHKTPFPIVVHILEGAIDFGVQGAIHALTKGSIVSLPGNIPHDLTARENSVVRLTLSKGDAAERVEKVAKNA